MILEPSQNKKLYCLNRYFNEIIKLYDSNRMPNKILLSGKKGLGKSTLAYHLINYILSKNETNKYDYKNMSIRSENRSFQLMQNKSHPNFFLIDLIDEKKIIDIAQVREMTNYTNKSTFNNTIKLILIDNIENLNKNSTNALLKIIEEPNNDTFFLLIHNNERPLLSTLKSRCINFKIGLTFDESIKAASLLLNKNIFDLINHDLISFYNTPGEIVNMINFSNDKNIDLSDYNLKNLLCLLIDNNYYKKNYYIKNLLINFIELYFLKQYKQSKTKSSLFNLYLNFTNKIKNTDKFNLDEESLFLEFRSKLINE